MRLLAYFGKTVREQVRDLASLSMVLVLCPFFVFLYWLIAGGGSTSYKVLVINRDGGAVLDGRGAGQGRGSGRGGSARPEVPERRSDAARPSRSRTGPRPTPICATATRRPCSSCRRISAACSTLPPAERSRFAPVVLSGDAGNVAYAVASVFVFTALDAVVRTAGGTEPPFPWKEEFVSGAAPRTEFEAYVPGASHPVHHPAHLHHGPAAHPGAGGADAAAPARLAPDRLRPAGRRQPGPDRDRRRFDRPDLRLGRPARVPKRGIASRRGPGRADVRRLGRRGRPAHRLLLQERHGRADHRHPAVLSADVVFRGGHAAQPADPVRRRRPPDRPQRFPSPDARRDGPEQDPLVRRLARRRGSTSWPCWPG